MARRNRTKLITLLLAMLSCITLFCTTALTVFADDPAPSFSEVVEALTEEDVAMIADVVDVTIEDKADVPDFFVDPNDQTKVAQLTIVLEIAKEKADLKGRLTDEYITQTVEPASVADYKDARDQLLASYKIEGAKLNAADWESYLADLQGSLETKANVLEDIINQDAAAFEQFAKDSAQKIADEYNRLIEKTQAGGGDEFSVEGYYSTAHATKLKEVFDLYVKQESEAYVFVNPIEYEASEVMRCITEVEELTKKAINELKAVPKNSIEEAYQLYNYWLTIKGNETEPDYNDTVAQLKTLANKAISDYENKATAQMKSYYSGEHDVLVDFIENIDGYDSYVPVRVDSLTDANGVVTITALYANGQKAEVLPDNCSLVIYSTSNGAAKRTASREIKKIDDNLSVAYFLSYRVIRHNNNYTLPSRDLNNKEITYQVTIDIKGYYDKYCNPTGREADKTENITRAQEIVSTLDNENASMCYGYEKGSIKSFEYTLEGGVLVFTTTSLLNNLCIAGANLDSLITNPLFWVACVLALIVIIALIKLIVKHVKYRIRFDSNGGTHVDSIRAAKGEYFVMPTPPVKDGYVFAGWFTDKALTQRFMGTCMTRRRGFKLYAKWACPVPSTRLIEMYDALRDLMRSYKKESFKPLLGLSETEMIASMYYKETHIQLNLAINPSVLEKEGIKVKVSKERKYAEIPTQIIISTEEVFATALDLTRRVLVSKGLQPIADYVPGEPSTEKERANGFAYMLRNDRVAKTAEDYFELLRIAVKSYVMEEDNGKFKPGDKVTLARLYITNEVACLHLPAVKGVKGLKASRNARFADTPVEIKILAPRDILEAYALIDAVMKSNGFVKMPENANDLQDVKVPATNGFAYTLIF